jgi:hypothetical protein
LPSKKIKTLLKDHVEKAIEIYKLWFLDDDENLQRNVKIDLIAILRP